MRRFLSITLLSGAAIGFALGFVAAQTHMGLAWIAKVRPQPMAESQALGAPNSVSDKALSNDEWLAKIGAINWNEPDGKELMALQVAMADNAAVRDMLLQRFRAEQEPVSKTMLRNALIANTNPDMVATALQLARSKDANESADGFLLLAELAPSDAAYALAKSKMVGATDPDVIATAVVALRPVDVPTIEEEQVLVARLLALVQLEAPMVRVHSVQKLVELERHGSASMDVVLRALSDSDGEVRQAAVGAVMIGSLRSDPIRKALMVIVRNEMEDVQTRGAALFALDRFGLTNEERAETIAITKDFERRFGPSANGVKN